LNEYLVKDQIVPPLRIDILVIVILHQVAQP
jgi:hypothetical protein